MTSEPDYIERAAGILSTFKYCRKQTGAYQTCLRKHGEGASACAAALATYQTCCSENAPAVISDLMAISARKCPAEVRRFEDCKRRFMSDEACESEDVAVLNCGAAHVILSATAKPGARR